MKSISYPLKLVDGDLAFDDSEEEIISSEIKAILETRLSERPYRQTYGSKQYVLKSLDLSDLLSSLSTTLETNLSLLGFSAIVVELDSSLTDLQQGIINLIIKYSLNNNELSSSYSLVL
jgi:hypothetical protein